MVEILIQSLINGAAVTVGLYVLWSRVGRIRETSSKFRLRMALLAGGISAVVTFVLLLIFNAS